jgi:hypothetical protein
MSQKSGRISSIRLFEMSDIRQAGYLAKSVSGASLAQVQYHCTGTNKIQIVKK